MRRAGGEDGGELPAVAAVDQLGEAGSAGRLTDVVDVMRLWVGEEGGDEPMVALVDQLGEYIPGVVSRTCEDRW